MRASSWIGLAHLWLSAALPLGGIRASAQEVDLDSGDNPARPAARSAIAATNLAIGLTDQLDVTLFHWRFMGGVDGSEVQARLRYGFNERLGMSVRYYGFYQPRTVARPAPRDHRFRYEIMVNTDLVGKLVLHQRWRFEYRWRDLPNEWRLRPFLRLDHPVRLGRQEFLAFAYAELYYNFRQQLLASVNPALGLSTNLAPRLTASLWVEYGEAYRSRRNSLNTFASLAYRLGHRWHPSEPEQQRPQ